ncbi:delta-class carbonic anhydrase [Ferriphaselus sp. R-1]|uniref:delta-class carbonic anhydrase n=1 Tax=Ferriphaselus sp. R-1 TaxID=1485544 RepID=UPI000557E2FD|nr:delta-class carbonic anhydrase [Ferriphaselus sp. R-1]
MKLKKTSYLVLAASLGLGSTAVLAHEHGHDEQGQQVCTGFGPQTPRDIDSKQGDNKIAFSMAPDHTKMNLCNIHFHVNAEHKAKDFSIPGEADEHGNDTGYKCNIGQKLSAAELAATAEPVCKSEHGELKPGDTIEVHWVHSSAPVQPGKTLGACLNPNVGNPDLRVESQVFVLVNDSKALDFGKMGYSGKVVNGYHQADGIPSNTGKPVLFTGSTTGPKYTNALCSPLQVTWSVRPTCAKLDINTVAKWCKSNVFGEDHAHGVRKLVTNPGLLSEIK